MEQLVENFKSLLSRMSYYNAAEGDWSREANARVKCRMDLQKAAKELQEAGGDLQAVVDAGGYLVDKFDWSPK